MTMYCRNRRTDFTLWGAHFNFGGGGKALPGSALLTTRTQTKHGIPLPTLCVCCADAYCVSCMVLADMLSAWYLTKRRLDITRHSY